MKRIDSLDQWTTLADDLRKSRYTIYQMQYDSRQPEGFRVRFWLTGRPVIEVVTHNEKVQDAIVNYQLK